MGLKADKPGSVLPPEEVITLDHRYRGLERSQRRNGGWPTVVPGLLPAGVYRASTSRALVRSTAPLPVPANRHRRCVSVALSSRHPHWAL